MMDYEITFASPDDEEVLQSVLIETDMGIAGDVTEHAVIKKDNEILGGGMLAQIGTSSYHLLVFAVRQGDHGRGIGRRLLNELIKQPWEYCLNGEGIAAGDYKITTVAKGESAKFYEKNGFVVCDFSQLDYPFDQQCDECPDRKDCNPAAMMFMGCKTNDC